VSARPVGKLQTVAGSVAITRTGEVIDQPLAGEVVYERDVIETGADASASITFVDGTRASTLIELDEFPCRAERLPASALVRIVSGRFDIIDGKSAAGDRITIDTPLGQLRSRRPGFGMGTVALGVFTFAFVPELRADGGDIALLDNGYIDYDDLKHGVYEIVTKGDHPQRIIVDSTTHTVVLRFRGSSVAVSEVTNTPAQMAQLENAYSDAYTHYMQGLSDPFVQQWQHAFSQPTTGPGGSSTSASILGLNGSGGLQGPILGGGVIITGNGGTGGSSGSGGSSGTIILGPPPPVPTNVVTWISPSSDFFQIGSDWDTGNVPTASNTVVINVPSNAVSSPLIVTINQSQTVGGLIIGPGVILEIIGGATLTAANQIQNAGIIEFVDPTLSISGTLFLSGGGMVAMPGVSGSTDNTANLIIAAKAGSTLVNVNNTIIGGNATIGQGDGALSLVNQAGGTIEATSNIPATLLTPAMSSDGIIILNTGNTISNAGLLEATASGTLDVKDAAINNTGSGSLGIVVDSTSTLLVDVGALQLIGGGQVALNGGTITGPGNELENVNNTIVGTGTISNLTLVNDAQGTINATGATLVLDTGGNIITNAGLIEASAGSTLQIKSDVANTGAVTALNGGTIELINDTLTGGQMTVQSGGEVVIVASATLDGVTVTDNSGFLANDVGGIEVSGAVLTLKDGTRINGSGTGTMTIESSGAQLLITSIGGAILDNLIVDDDISGPAVGIDVVSTLTLQDGTQIRGGADHGTMTIEPGGQLAIGTGGAGLDGVFVTDGSATKGIDVSGGTLTLSDGTVISGGTMTVESTTNSTLLITVGSNFDGATAGGATLTNVTVTDNKKIEVSSGGVLTLNGGSQIISSGTGTLAIDSGATLDLNGATVSGGIVTIAGLLDSTGTSAITGAAITITGTLEATSGTLTISSGSLSNAGTLEADGGTLDLETTVTGSGGSILVMTSGILEIDANQTSNVSFASDGSGILQFDHPYSSAGSPFSFTGTISEFPV